MKHPAQATTKLVLWHRYARHSWRTRENPLPQLNHSAHKLEGIEEKR
ncbi:hypothetical protein ADIAG_03014 [Paeniglutamicibacter gangotriensis Lz1y]|uniref:Uncharacterized protein n=1 Tax=Paeniglutamicibacter gangotriensis Lz1y TaxID=1276920 RepID=M7N784_9MICC|nr:hypothetical protein ADIAG_03014 [Paeniglutamicibacter gangotriensis Lz1y]